MTGVISIRHSSSDHSIDPSLNASSKKNLRMKIHWPTWVVPLTAAFCVSGCASPRTTLVKRDWRSANIHKVIVACVQGDDPSNRRIESHLVPKLRHQGFDAIAITDLFPAAAKYSPQELMATMQRSGVDGIMEAVYSGESPKDGVPRRIAYKYHPIKGRSEKISDRRRSLDSALTALIGPDK